MGQNFISPKSMKINAIVEMSKLKLNKRKSPYDLFKTRLKIILENHETLFRCLCLLEIIID